MSRFVACWDLKKFSLLESKPNPTAFARGYGKSQEMTVTSSQCLCSLGLSRGKALPQMAAKSG